MSSRHAIARALGELGARLPAPARSAEVEHVSLGSVCHMAAAFRDAGLRRWSGPFDWLFSSPALVAECLRDEFRTLLDPAELRSVPAEEVAEGCARQCRHPRYEERFGLPIIFNHQDPAGSVVDRVKFGRSVGRLRAALANPGTNLLGLVAVDRPGFLDDLDALPRELTRTASRNILLAVEVTTGAPTRSARMERRQDGRLLVLRARVEVPSGWRSLRFADPEDDACLRQLLLQASAMAAREGAPV